MCESQNAADFPGGSGGDSTPTARDTRLAERAVRQRWPITDEMRQKIADSLSKVASNGRASHRNKIAAARALTAMDALNMEQEKRELQIPDHVHVTGKIQVIRYHLPDQITADGGSDATGN